MVVALPGGQIWNYATVAPPGGQIWNFAMVALPGGPIWNCAMVAPPGAKFGTMQLWHPWWPNLELCNSGATW